MIATPAADTANCIGMPPKNSLSTRCPSTESRMPRQKIWRELRPQITKGRAARLAKNRAWGWISRATSSATASTLAKRSRPRSVLLKNSHNGLPLTRTGIGS